MNDDYSDIMNMEHHVSAKRAHMSMIDRAAQFSPFAALTGFEDHIAEEARLTGSRITDEERISLLDEKMSILKAHIKESIAVAATYFVPDKKKAGGEYVTKYGIVKKADETGRKLVFKDGEEISFDEIYDIEFPGLNDGDS
ncbi:MAG: YolD-like family protein [Lachnospiraceae bacterium]|nr:YolD-like family protein [Lachnospiraceae bacterium]